MATAHVYDALPLRGAALKQILKTTGHGTAINEEVKESEQNLVKKKNAPKRKPNAISATPKKSSELGTMNFVSVVYREMSPSSPETDDDTEEKGKKRKKDVKTVDLFTLMNKAMATKNSKKSTPKKRGKWIDEDSESEADQGNSRWFNGNITPEELSMDKLQFMPGTYFIGRYKILDVVDMDDDKGATYIAYRNTYEVILRVNFIQKDDMTMVTTEAKFLEMMELNGAQHFFSTFYDMGLVNKDKADGLAYYSVLYRGGPTLQQCRTFCEQQILTTTMQSGTVDKLASQLIKIMEQIFGQGYRILSFSMDDFKIDYRSRIVYLHNYRNIVKAGGNHLERLGVNEKKRMGWMGHEDLAPVNWHKEGENHVMSEMDSIESLVYLLIQMHRGPLPWTGQEEKEALKMVHADLTMEEALINSLPPSVKCLWSMVRSTESSRVSFSFIHQTLTKYSNDDTDVFYDWEMPCPSTIQERLICLTDSIADARIMRRAANCILENESRLSKR